MDVIGLEKHNKKKSIGKREGREGGRWRRVRHGRDTDGSVGVRDPFDT